MFSCLSTNAQQNLQNTPRGISISSTQLQKIKDDISLGIPKDVSVIKEEKERKKEEMRQRKEEFRQLDEQYGRSSKETSMMRTLAEDIERAKQTYYGQRANVLKLRDCEDFKKMNSFVYKAKCQAIRDHQIQQKEIMKRDADILLEKEINGRYRTMEEDWEKELKSRAETKKLNDIHLSSLKYMIEEKEIENELKRLKYQHAAMIRNNHTAFRLKKRLDEIAEKGEANKKVRALQRGVYENKLQLEVIKNAEKEILDQREKNFFERKSSYLKKFNEERGEELRKKNEHLQKLREEAEKRNQNEEHMSELAYIREKDLADKKWRMEMEEKEQKRQAYKQQLWEEQEKTKEDILDHICLATERDRIDFERIVRENEEDYQQEKRLELQKKKDKEAVRRDLQCTINEKIERKREEQERLIQNAKSQVINNRLYMKHHDQEMFRELGRLREEGLEETYINETLRHCHITPDQKLKKSLI